MLHAQKRLLASAAPPAPSPSPRSPEVQVAAPALLLELAHANAEFCAEEQAYVRPALCRHFALGDAAVTAPLAYAEEARVESIDHCGLTRPVVAQHDLGQKRVLVGDVEGGSWRMGWWGSVRRV